MKLKGEWSPEASYDVGDVVVYGDIAYHLQHSCPAGTSPVDTRYWSRTSQAVNDMVDLVMDGVALAMDGVALAKAAVEAEIPRNIDDEGIILKAGDNEYMVSVDASGETPEVVAELIVPDEEEET